MRFKVESRSVGRVEEKKSTSGTHHLSSGHVCHSKRHRIDDTQVQVNSIFSYLNILFKEYFLEILLQRGFMYFRNNILEIIFNREFSSMFRVLEEESKDNVSFQSNHAQPQQKQRRH